MDYKMIINGHELNFKITCIKYSRITSTWVFFAKGYRRKVFPIRENEVEILLRQQTFTRHDQGDEILFQINRPPGPVMTGKFDLKSLLKP